jgi:hypothetical protein
MKWEIQQDRDFRVARSLLSQSCLSTDMLSSDGVVRIIRIISLDKDEAFLFAVEGRLRSSVHNSNV